MAKLKYFVRPECGSVDMIGPTFGPFNEFIQLTYGEVRVGPDGDIIGGRGDDGMWYFETNYRCKNEDKPVPMSLKEAHNCPEDLPNTPFSDVVIWAE
jgi:hypothetical protein